MIVQKDFLNKLKDFGLNSYESKLWIALLSRGVSTAGELSDIANVPRSRSYDVLESLEKKGYVEKIHGVEEFVKKISIRSDGLGTKDGYERKKNESKVKWRITSAGKRQAKNAMMLKE